MLGVSYLLRTVLFPQYDPTFGNAFWNSSVEGFGMYVFLLLTNWALVCDVWYLPKTTRRVRLTLRQTENRLFCRGGESSSTSYDCTKFHWALHLSALLIDDWLACTTPFVEHFRVIVDPVTLWLRCKLLPVNPSLLVVCSFLGSRANVKVESTSVSLEEAVRLY